MNQRVKILSSISALALVPALAFAGQPEPSQGSQGSEGSSSTTSSAPMAPSAEPSPSDPSTSGSSSSSSASGDSATSAGSQSEQRAGVTQSQGNQSPGMAASAQPIDRSQIQKVFGMDAEVVDLSSLGEDQVRMLQQSLKDKGRYHGEIDGIIGPQTRAALNATLAEQHALTQRLIAQGQITGQLASSLGLNTDRANVSGMELEDDAEVPSEPGLNNQGSSGSSLNNQGNVRSFPNPSPSQRETDSPVAPPPSNANAPLYPSAPPTDSDPAPRR